MPYKTPPQKKPYRRPGQSQTPSWYKAGNVNGKRPSAPGGTYSPNWGTDVRDQVIENNDLRTWLNDQFGPVNQDPWGGADAYDILNFGNNPTNGGGGGRGSGGGGGSAAASAATNAAYQQMLAALKQKQSADMAGFDTRQGSINDLATQGGTRLAGILGTLNTGAANTRQAVQDSYNRSDATQAGLQAQFAAQEAARTQGAGQTLGMFGGTPDMVNREYGASDMLNAQRGMMAGVQGANDSMWAGRGAVYDGLFADAQTQNSTMQQQLLQQLAVSRQQAAAAAAAEQAKLQFEGSQAGVKF